MCDVTIPGLVGPTALALNGDQTQLYVGHVSGIALFDRDPATGMVTLVDDGIADPPADTGGFLTLTVSPDGATVFAGGNGVWTYDRDTTTGLLRPFQTTQVLGTFALSPDGAFLYGPRNTVTAFAVRPTLECAAVPVSGCRNPVKPGKSTIQIRDAAVDEKDQINWKWTNGSATTEADIGDPTIATSYVLASPTPRAAVSRGSRSASRAAASATRAVPVG